MAIKSKDIFLHTKALLWKISLTKLLLRFTMSELEALLHPVYFKWPSVKVYVRILGMIKVSHWSLLLQFPLGQIILITLDFTKFEYY